MATQTLSNFDAILKNVYRGPIVELLNQETFLIDRVEGKNVNDLGTFTGRQLVFPVHTSRNRGRGYITDGGTLATAGKQGYLDGIVSIKYFDGAIELTDPVIQQTKTDEGAFTRAMTSEMEGATTDMRKDICRAGYGTGDGVLANCTSSDTSTTVIHVDSTQYIAIGDTVDILVKTSGATTTNGTAASVTAVTNTGTAGGSTQANGTITLGSAVTVTNINSVYITGDRSNETDGLQNIISTGRTLHQINSSTYPIWDANTKAAGWVNANEDLFMQQAQTTRQRAGAGHPINAILTTLGVQRRLANNYVSQKRWNDDRATQVEGGYEAINISAGGKTTPVIADVDAVNGMAFGLCDDSFAWAEVARPDWLEAPDGKGSIFHLKDGSTAGTKVQTWQAFICWYATLVNVAPLRNFKVTQLNDDLPVARV